MEKQKSLQEMLQDLEVNSKLSGIVKEYIRDNERSIEWTTKNINETLARIENGEEIPSWEMENVESSRLEIKARNLFTEKLLKAFS